jgi:hypothetical protein
MLKLRKGWKTYKADDYAYTYLYAPEEGLDSPRWYVNMDPDGQNVCAYPHGGWESVEFDTIEEAHAYFLSVGSDSPWEEV